MSSVQALPPFAVRGDRSAVARFFLGACAASAALVFFSAYWQLGQRTEPWRAAMQTSVMVLADSLQIVTAVVFAIWLHRAYANLRPLGAKPMYTPAMAVAYFFIPAVNFIVPHAILREIWRESDPGDVRTLARMPRRPIDVVSAWWYLFVIYSVGSNVTLMLLADARPHLQSAAQLAIVVTSALGVIAAIVGLDMVGLIDTRQQLRRRALESPQSAPRDKVTSESTSGWREVMLPVVSAVEKEIAREEIAPPRKPPALQPGQPALEPAPPVQLARRMQTNVAAPRSRFVSSLLMAAAVLAFLQAPWPLLLLLAQRPRPLVAVVSFLFPFGLLFFSIAIATAIAFSLWLASAYSALTAFGETPRVHFDALRDFLRGAGDPDVLSEAWAMTMSAEDVVSLDIVERWAKVWRAFQIALAIAVVMFLFLPGTLATFVFAVMFALGGVAALHARKICNGISEVQQRRLSEPAPVEPPLGGAEELP